MRRTLSPPLPFATIQGVPAIMLELPEPLEGLHGFRRQGDMARREVVLSAAWEINNARQSVDDLRFDLGHLVRQRPVGWVDRPRKKDPCIHAVEVPLERSSELVRLQSADEPDQ